MGDTIKFVNLNLGYQQCYELHNLSKTQGAVVLEGIAQVVDSLKRDWIGNDATLHINRLIKEYDGLTEFLNGTIASLSIASEGIIATQQVRHSGDHSQKVDTVLSRAPINARKLAMVSQTESMDTNKQAQKADFAKFQEFVEVFDKFTSTFDQDADALMGNWMSGANREGVRASFDRFRSAVARIRTLLTNTTTDQTTTTSNYSGI